MKYWIFNLKSKLTFSEIKTYEQQIDILKNKIIIAPSFLYLNYFINHNYTICAQDVSKYPSGNYTGEVNATQLASLNVSYVIIGHYERRKYFHESLEEIILKIKQALKANLKVILCIGSSKQNIEHVITQIDIIFKNFNNLELSNIILAYEPYDYIGNNLIIDHEQINEIIKTIKFYIKQKYQIDLDILYGGSVNLKNLDNLKNMPVDGFLIGEMSTKIDEIFTLINSF